MTAATTTNPYATPDAGDGRAFLDSLPLYRLAMHCAAVNMADLNFPGSPRTQAMTWWVSDDEGLAQVSQAAEFIGRFHEELLRLPSPEGAGHSIASLRVLTEKGGQSFSLADTASKEEALGLMRVAAGITEEADGGRMLSDTAEARRARGVSASLIREACDRVCAHVRQRFAPEDKTPKHTASYRPSPAWSTTPTL